MTLDAVRGTDAAGRPIATAADLIGSWAPSSDPRNDTPAYIAAVGASTGYDVYAPLWSLGAGGSMVSSSVSLPPGDAVTSPDQSPDSPVMDAGVFDFSSVPAPVLVAGGLAAFLLLAKIF